MSGIGLAGFVNGVFDGIDTRQRWQDRKLEQARQKRREEILAAAEARASERFGWDREDRKRRLTQEDAILQASKDAWAATEQAMAADQVGTVPEAPPAPAQQPAVPSLAAPAPTGVPLGGIRMPQASDITMSVLPASPASQTEAQIAAAKSPSLAPAQAPAQVDPSQPSASIPAVDPNRSAFIQDWQAGSRDRAIASQVTQIADGLAMSPSGMPLNSPMGRFLGGVKDYFTETPETAAQKGAERERGAAAIAWYRSPEAVDHFRADPSRLDKAKADPIAYAEAQVGAAAAPAASEPAPPPPAQSAAPPAPATSQPLGAIPDKAAPAVPAGAPESAKQIGAAAVEAISATPSPTAKAIASASANLGAPGGRKASESDLSAASKSMIDYYMENGAPVVMRAMLMNGRLEDAMKFQEFMKKEETRKGMENWSRATWAATVGDYDTFASQIIEAYNRLDYFGDDTTILKDQSGFVDASGKLIKEGSGIEPAGAKLVMRNETTGATFEQNFSGIEDMIKTGITLLAPEEAFEWHLEQLKAGQAAKAEALKEAATSGNDATKQMAEIVKQLAEEDPGFSALSDEEKAKRLQARLALIGQGSLGGLSGGPATPPVVYRN